MQWKKKLTTLFLPSFPTIELSGCRTGGNIFVVLLWVNSKKSRCGFHIATWSCKMKKLIPCCFNSFYNFMELRTWKSSVFSGQFPMRKTIKAEIFFWEFKMHRCNMFFFLHFYFLLLNKVVNIRFFLWKRNNSRIF